MCPHKPLIVIAIAYYIVVSEQGPAWIDSQPMREQEDWAGHATFMNALADDGFVVLGGPIGDGTDTVRVSSSGRAAKKACAIGSPATRGQCWVC